MKPSPHPWWSDSEAPLYVLTFPTTVTDESLSEFTKAMEAWWPTVDEHIAVVVNALEVETSSPKHRQDLAAYEKRIAPYSGKWVTGVGFAMNSTFVRGILTAIYWFAPPAYPYKLFPTLQAARQWAVGMLRKGG